MFYMFNLMQNADFYECLSIPYDIICENVLKCIYVF